MIELLRIWTCNFCGRKATVGEDDRPHGWESYETHMHPDSGFEDFAEFVLCPACLKEVGEDVKRMMDEKEAE